MPFVSSNTLSLGLKVGLDPKTPLKQNYLVPMTLNNLILDQWYQQEIQHLMDNFYNGLFMTFDHLKRKEHFSNQTFFLLSPSEILPESYFDRK